MKPIVNLENSKLSHWLNGDHADRLVIGFATILITCIWVLAGVLIQRDENQTIASTQRENANLARAFAEHSTRTLKSVDQAVLFLKFQYEKFGSKINIAEFVQEGMIISQIFNQLGIIDEHGMYITSNLASFKPMYLGDREHFRVHQESNSNELYVSKPVLGRASGKWSLQLTRRINKPDGSFGGVVVVSLDPFYFSNFYSGVNLGKNGVVTLVGEDGIVRARRAGEDTSVGQNLKGSPLLEHLVSQAQGNYLNTSVVDGITRLYSYQRLEGYPLAVAVGVSQDDALSEYRERRWQLLSLSIVSTILILVFTTILVLMLQRQKQANAALRESQLKAESANRMKSEFLAAMSHELRTPINGILGYSEYLADDCQEATQKEFAETIFKSSQHLLSLVNSLLDLAKIEAGRMGVFPTQFKLREAIIEVANLHQVTAQQRHLAFNLRFGDDLPEFMTTDRTKLVQILNNLTHNAIKFTNSGSINLEISHLGQLIRFGVRDTGIGIPPEMQAAVFERFRQVEAFETRTQGGTGLGLALVKELVALLGGTLSLESEPGLGTYIFFDLPLQPLQTPEKSETCKS